MQDKQGSVGVLFLDFLIKILLSPIFYSLGLTLNEIRTHGELGRWKRKRIFQVIGHVGRMGSGPSREKSPISAGRKLLNPYKSSVHVAFCIVFLEPTFNSLKPCSSWL